MANDRLIFEVVAEGKNLKVVQRDADSVAKSVERTNKARDEGLKSGNRYHKQEKGIYQTGLSSAKGFSKMQQAIGSGSSGLVGAYATLAANVFAATAAFNALRSAAQVEQLAQGLEFVGVQGGRNLKAIAEGLREITGLAISSEESMRSVALGTSAGFSTTQMEDLTKVARGASLALGRDMGDAMSRLVRGAAKLEPEILDELGIMVRLDDATQAYADSMRKSVDSLSQYERRMAFINAINEQGIKNFGDLSAAVDPNAYDILSASLQDLYKSFVTLLNTGLAPIAEFIAGSVPVMLGGVALFASTISRQLAPSLFNAASGAAAAAKGVQEMAAAKLQDLRITKGFPKGYKAFNDSVIAGTASLEEMEIKQKKLTNSIRTHQRHVDKYTGAIPTPEGDKERTGISSEEDLIKKKALINEMTTAQTALNESMDGGAKAQIKNAEAAGYSKAQFGTLKEGWNDITMAQTLQREETKKNTKTQSKARQSMAMLGTGFENLGKRAKFMGTAFLNSIPALGMIITVLGLAWEAIDRFLIKTDIMSETLDKLQEAGEHIDKTFRQLATSLRLIENSVDRTTTTWKAYSGAVQTAVDSILNFGKAQKEAAITDRQTTSATLTNLERVKAELEAFKKEGKNTGQVVKKELWGPFSETVNWTSLTELDRQLGKVNDEIAKQETHYNNLSKARTGAIDPKDANTVARGIREQATRLAQFGTISQVEVIAMNKIADKVAAGTITQFEKLDNEMINIASSSQNVQSSLISIADANSKFIESVNKFGQKNVTPYDDMIQGLEGIEKQFEAVEARVEAVRTAEEEKGNIAGANKVATEEREKLNAAMFEGIKLGEIELENTQDGLKTYIKRVNAAREALIKNKAEVKLLEAAHKKVSEVAKGVPEFLEKQLDLEEQILRKKIEGLTADLNAQKDLLPATLDKEEIEERIAGINIQIAALKSQILSEEVKSLKTDIAREKHALKMFQIQQSIANAAKATFQSKDAQLKAESEIAALQRRSGNRELSPRETFALDIKAAMTALNSAKIQHKMKMRQQEIDFAIINMETKLLKQQTQERLEAEKAAAHKLIATGDYEKMGTGISMLEEIKAEENNTETFFQNIFNLVEEKRDALQVLADQELNLAFSVREASFAKAGQAFKSSVVSAMSGQDTIAGVSQAYFKAMRSNREQQAILRKDAVEQAEKTFKLENAELHPIALEQGAITAGSNAGTEFDTQMSGGAFDMGERMQMLQAQMTPMIEMMKTLGPEGEFAAAAQQGLLNTTMAINDFSTEFGEATTKTEKAAAGLALASNMAASVANIMAAASQMKIAAIDKEIEQTKKLYGGTKKGEEMVAKLEKKKEAQKKKAFKQNKAMMMAQAVMSTALGMIQVWNDPTMANIAKGIMMGVVAAIGAAQLAVISSMSYQGGGSSAPSAPSRVSIGSKSKNVDVAGSRPGGELAYLRGERGIGSSASDFSRRGAFTGRYHRATGGAAYVVGEQGPELFVPEVPGQIVANDEIGEGGTPANVTFNIQTIDATNMEETLISQRGNIINMIREAANNQGETFLEGLDTMALGDNY